jgi:hypothetical protein
MTLRDIDDGLYCMFMNQVEIMDAVVDEINENVEEYAEENDNDVEDMIRAACDNLGYNYHDLSGMNIRDIAGRIEW